MTLMDRRLGGFNHRREITVDRREGSREGYTSELKAMGSSRNSIFSNSDRAASSRTASPSLTQLTRTFLASGPPIFPRALIPASCT